MENIAKAILKVTEWIKWLEKDSTVWTWNNSYKGISEKMVKSSIKSLMIENGLSIMPISVEANTKIDRWEEVDTWSKETPKPMKSKQSIFTEVTTRYLLLHTSGENIELAGYGQWVDTQDKGAGKATTYALKNTLMNTFMMITWEDTDDTHSQDIEVPKKQYKVAEGYTMTKSDVDNKWNGKIYPSNIVYIDWEKKKISNEQCDKLKKHEKYSDLPDKK